MEKIYVPAICIRRKITTDGSLERKKEKIERQSEKRLNKENVLFTIVKDIVDLKWRISIGQTPKVFKPPDR